MRCQCEANRLEGERMVGQLADFLEGADLASVPLRELERIRGTARHDWQALVPMAPRSNRGLSRRFEALMDQLSAAIRQRRERLHEERRGLVDEAEALMGSDDPEAAAESAKALQRRWKAMEATGAGRERRSWRAFRTACDRIFEARDRARAERSAAAEARLADARTVVTVLEGLMVEGDSDDPGPEALQANLSTQEARWATLGLPPGRTGQELVHRYERARKGVRQRLQVSRSVTMLANVESALEAGVSPDRPEDLPRPLREAIHPRGSGEVSSHDEETQRDLCLGMEILAGVESPQEDGTRRMELQVERLANGLGGDGAAEQGLWSLIGAWYARPVTDQALAARFRRAAETALRSLP